MTRVVLVTLLLACGSSSEPGPKPGSASGSAAAPAPAPSPVTPRAFFHRGLPSYVVGTAGDEVSDRAIRGQADLLRSLLTPDARLVPDTEVAGKPATAWPANPIVYGGAHVNAAIAAIAKDLPFVLTAHELVIGGHTLEGDGYALLAVVPARADRYPEFLLYAGTGTPGIAEINSPSVTKVEAPIVVADAFGTLMVGGWKIGPDGVATAQLGKPARRVAWRATTRTIGQATVTFKLWEGAPADRDAAWIALAERGIAQALGKLAIERPVAFDVVIHPDQRSKGTLTGNAGAGHVIAFARTLHVFAFDGLAQLTSHEATHVIAPQLWPPVGTPLFGEGLAVWTAGGYAGKPLASFKGTLKPRPIAELLGSGFRALPEGEAYPFAGIVVDTIVTKLGLAKLRDHLYGATAQRWSEACEAAGTTAAELDAAVAVALGH